MLHKNTKKKVANARKGNFTSYVLGTVRLKISGGST